MSTLQASNHSTQVPSLRLSLPIEEHDQTVGRRDPADAIRREPFRLPFALADAPVLAPRPTRAIRLGTEPGRVNTQARRVSPAQAAKHSKLIRAYLAEPDGDFDRCLSIALDRMIDAVQSRADLEASR